MLKLQNTVTKKDVKLPTHNQKLSLKRPALSLKLITGNYKPLMEDIKKDRVKRVAV